MSEDYGPLPGTTAQVSGRVPRGVAEQLIGVRVPEHGWAWLTGLVATPVYASLMHHATAGNLVAGELVTALHVGTTIGVSAMAWHHIGGRSVARRVAVTSSLAWHGGLATVLTVVGPWHWPYSMIWVAGSTLCASYWGIRAMVRRMGADDHGGGALGQVAELTHLARAQVTAVGVSEHGAVVADLALPPGVNARAAVSGETPAAIASVLDIPTSRVRTIPSPDSARRARLEIDTIDHLATPTTWRGASALGASIGVPLRVGRYADGTDVLVDLTGLASGGSSEHVIVTGTSGSGKTDSVVGLVADALTRSDVLVIVVDLAKGHQSYGHLAPHLWLETDRTRVAMLLRRLQVVITERTAHLGRAGLKSWQPGCGLTYLILVIEEAWTLLAGGSYDGIVMTARSAGISLIPSVQRATHAGISTEIRAQMSAHWCHGVLSADDATYGLPDTLHGVVHPETWGRHQPGMAYLAGAGIGEVDAARPMRADRHDHIRDDMATYLTQWRGHLGITTGLDEVTAAAFGEVWTTRPTTTPATVTTPATAAAAAAGLGVGLGVDAELVDEHDEDDQEEATAAAEVAAVVADAIATEVADLTPAEVADLGPILHPTAQLAATHLPDDDGLSDAELDGLDPAGGVPRRSGGSLRREWVAWVAHLHQAGAGVLYRSDAVEWAGQRGRSDSWVDEQLRLLTDDGVLTRTPTPGQYRITTAPVDPVAALLAGATA